MSILDVDDFDFDKMASKEILSKNYALLPIKKTNTLDNIVFHEIKKLVNFVDLLPYKLECSKNCRFLGLLPIFNIRHENNVEISDDEPLLKDLHEIKDIEEILLLGRYYSDQKKVVLYIKNIKKVDEGNWQKLLTAVYIHELYHAYFKTDPYTYTPIVEEPLAELGTLYTLDCMESIGIFDEGICKYYLEEVSKKTGSIYFYGFGAELYKYSDFGSIGEILEEFNINWAEILSKAQSIKQYEELLQSIIAQGPKDPKTKDPIEEACESFYKLCGISLDK